MSLPNNLGRLSAAITSDASLNLGVGVTPSGTYKFEVGTTSKFTGVATFGSTMSNGTYTYTLPSATGTLALTSAIPTNAVGASGFWTSGFLAKINGTYTVTSSIIQDDGGSHVAIGYLTNPALYMLDVNGTGKFVGQLTLGSTITNGTYTYTLPSATGTLALTSALSGYLPLTGGTLTGALTVGVTSGLNLILEKPSGAYLSFNNASTVRGSISGNNGADGLNLNYGASHTTALAIASTGAATFSSSVTAKGPSNDSWVFQGLNSSGITIAGFYQNTTAGGWMALYNSAASQTVQIASNSTSWLNGGNVGIGTSSPLYRLHIVPNVADYGIVLENLNANSYGAYFRGGKADGTTSALDVVNVAGTGLLSVRGSGNVLIGTTTDNGSKFQVTGAATFSSNITTNSPGGGINSATFNDRTGAVGAVVDQYGTLAAYSGILNNNGDYGSGASGTPLVFKSGAVEQFRVSATNMVVIGSVTNKVTNISADGAGVVLQGYVDNNLRIAVRGSGYNDGGRGGLLASTGDFSSLTTGTVYSNGGTLTNTNPSDSSLKNSIEPLSYGLDEILQLQPKTFYYNSDSTKSNLKYGFIAQDVQPIMPDIVREIGNGSDKLGLESDGINVAMVNAIKELSAQIKELQSQINK